MKKIKKTEEDEMALIIKKIGEIIVIKHT